jgi:hypothetical protein
LSTDEYTGELARLVDRAFHTYHRIQLQQFKGHGGVLQINLPGPKGGDDLPRQGLNVNLEADRQRGRRIDRRNGFVHPQHLGPELFVPECVEAKDGLPISMIVVVSRATSELLCVHSGAGPRHDERQRESEYD